MICKTEVCTQVCEGSTSHVPMPPTKSKERVSNVHKVNSNKNPIVIYVTQYCTSKTYICIIEYTYCHRVFYVFFSHLNLVQLREEARYTHFPLNLVRTTCTNPESYLEQTITGGLTCERRLS